MPRWTHGGLSAHSVLGFVSAFALAVLVVSCTTDEPAAPPRLVSQPVQQPMPAVQMPPLSPTPAHNRSSAWNGGMACGCEHLPSLERDLATARSLKASFEAAARDLAGLDEDKAHERFEETVKTLGKATAPPPGYRGPPSVNTVLRGQEETKELVDRLARGSRQDLALCEMSKPMETELAAAMTGSVCKAMADSLEAHEKAHVKYCKRRGYQAYERNSASGSAQNEADAYSAQIAVLEKEVQKLRRRCKAYTFRLQGQIICCADPVNTSLINGQQEFSFRLEGAVAGDAARGRPADGLYGLGDYVWVGVAQYSAKPERIRPGFIVCDYRLPGATPGHFEADVVASATGRERLAVSFWPTGEFPVDQLFARRCESNAGMTNWAEFWHIFLALWWNARFTLDLPTDDDPAIRGVLDAADTALPGEGAGPIISPLAIRQRITYEISAAPDGK